MTETSQVVELMTIANRSKMQLFLLIHVARTLSRVEAFVTNQALVSSLRTPALSQLDMKKTGGQNLHLKQYLLQKNKHPNNDFTDGWSFQKAPPKTSLKTVGPGNKDQSETAVAWILNLVEGAHWLTFLPTFLGTYAVMLNHDFWLNMFGESELRVLLWCLAPFVSFVGALPAFTMHTYESWQIAPFKSVDENFSIQDFNNSRLREIVYKYLFIFQSIGLLMANHGYDGFSLIGISVALVLLSYVGDQSEKATFEFNGQEVFPVPIVVLPLFIWAVVFNLWISVDLASHVGSNTLVHWGLIISPILASAGGVVEGVIAESTFNQWIHLYAVIILFAGSSLQFYSLLQAPELFV